MNEVNKLGLRLALITLVLLIILYGGYRGVKALLTPNNSNNSKSINNSLTELAAADTDADGLPDAFEAEYLTAFDNADTDGDGTNDLAEIEEGRNPIQAGPDDAIVPATGEEVLDLTTYTGRYLATLPEEAARGDILSKERIEAFLELEEPILLPDVTSSVITTSDTGKTAITAYLDSISASHNKELKTVTNEDISAALTSQLQLNPEPMKLVVSNLEKNVKTLAAIAAPAEVKSMHTKFLAASQSLLQSATLLRDLDNDFVGGLLGSRDIDNVGVIFQDIASQVASLEKKYSLE